MRHRNLAIVPSSDVAHAPTRAASRLFSTLGAETYYIGFPVPKVSGKFLLKAVAEPTDKGFDGPTISRRRVTIAAH